MKSKFFAFKNLHLIISIIVIIPVAFIYGFHPAAFWSNFIALKINNIDLMNILKAIMGMYLAFTAIWIVGLIKPVFWLTATLTNILFMGGLAIGRLLSVIFDGIPSNFYLAGCLLELMLALLGVAILIKEKSTKWKTWF